jgi:hypothetical protein
VDKVGIKRLESISKVVKSGRGLRELLGEDSRVIVG